MFSSVCVLESVFFHHDRTEWFDQLEQNFNVNRFDYVFDYVFSDDNVSPNVSTTPKLLPIKKHCFCDQMNLVPIHFQCAKGLLKVTKAFWNDLHPSLRVQNTFGISSTKYDVCHCNYHRKSVPIVKRYFNKENRYCTIWNLVEALDGYYYCHFQK